MRRALVTGLVLGVGLALGTATLVIAEASKRRHFRLELDQVAFGLELGLVMGLCSSFVLLPQLLIRERARPRASALVVVSTLPSAFFFLTLGVFALVYTYLVIHEGRAHTRALEELGGMLRKLLGTKALWETFWSLAPFAAAFSVSALLSELRFRTIVRSLGCAAVAVPLGYSVASDLLAGWRQTSDFYFMIGSALNLAVLLPQAISLGERIDLRLERRLRGLGHA
jgi:hypothetical protein